MTGSVSIIIPNFNGERLLTRNLPSVCRYAGESELETEIIVVDDASTDDSVRTLAENFGQVRTIVHETNQGFSAAVHSGVRAARFELLLLLNSDVALVEDIISPLAGYFDEPDTFSVSPLIVNEHEDIDRHAWNLRHIRGGRLKLMDWKIGEARKRRSGGRLPTCYASGGSMMVRKRMFDTLGGFHPLFRPFYGEDFDLGLRAWARGWPSFFEPGVRVIHQESGSISQTKDSAYVKAIQRRNRYLLEWVHFSNKQLCLSTLPVSLIQLFGELLTLDIVNLKGFLLACRELNRAKKARAELSENRLLTVEDIVEKVCAQQETGH